MAGTGETVAFAAIALWILGSGIASSLAKRTFHSVMFLGSVLVGVGALYILLGSPLVGVLQILVYVGGILTLFVFAVMFVTGDETEDDAPAASGASRAMPGVLRGALAAVAGLAVLAVGTTVKVPGVKLSFQGLHIPHQLKLFAQGLVNLGATGESIVGLVGGLVGFVLVLGIAVLVAAFAYRFLLVTVGRAFGSATTVAILAVMALAIGATPLWSTDGAGAGTSDQQLDGLVDGLFKEHVVALELLGVLLTAAMVGALVMARPLTGKPDRANYPTLTQAQLHSGEHAADVEAHTGTGHNMPQMSPSDADAAHKEAHA